MKQNKKQIIKNYIFDFDGTIVDSLPAMIIVYNNLIRSEDNPITSQEVDKLRGMTSRQALRHLGVHWWQMPKLLLLGKHDFHELVPGMKSFNNIPEVIKELKMRGKNLYIVTSNSHENVMKFLEINHLDKYFIEIASGSGLFNKAKHIRRLMKGQGLKRKETVYIGDETRDIQAARLSFICSVSVSWGLNTKRILSRQRPTYLVDNPKEILEISL